MPNSKVSHRLAANIPLVLDLNVSAHQLKNVDNARASRVNTDMCQSQIRAGRNAARYQEKRRRTNIRWHINISRSQFSTADQTRRCALSNDFVTKSVQHVLGVITSRCGLSYRCFTFGK